MNFNHLKYISYFLDNKKDFTIRFTKNNNLIIPSFGFIVSITPLIKFNMNIIPNLPILHSKKTVGKFVFTQNYLQSLLTTYCSIFRDIKA